MPETKQFEKSPCWTLLNKGKMTLLVLSMILMNGLAGCSMKSKPPVLIPEIEIPTLPAHQRPEPVVFVPVYWKVLLSNLTNARPGDVCFRGSEEVKSLAANLLESRRFISQIRTWADAEAREQ